MKDILLWAVQMWQQYWGDGFIQYLLLGSVVILSVKYRKKPMVSELVCYTVLILALFFCPLSAKVIMRCVGDIVYWRFLWLLPLIPVTAGAFTWLIRSGKKKEIRVILALVLAALVLVSGKGMVRAGNFERVHNFQKVPDEVAQICDIINGDRGEKEIRIAADEHVASYVRVYDPSIHMAYGRRGSGSLGKNSRKLYKEIISEAPDPAKIAKLGKSVKCDYLVFTVTEGSTLEIMEKYGYEVAGAVEGYYVFVCKNLNN
nr:hypothetical protein [uncultured Blautia sp.]